MQTLKLNNIGGNIGTYAVSTISLDSWMNDTSSSNIKGKKTKSNKAVIHRIFADCAAVIDDPFWIEKFTEASQGKFPQKFAYRDNKLLYKRAARIFDINVSSSPYEAAYQCMEFIRKHGCIYSPEDEQLQLQRQCDRQADAQLNYVELTWETAGKRTQDALISYYVLSMEEMMGLSATETKQLRQTIKLAIFSKTLGNHNIVVENKRIFKIDGLLFDGQKRVFYINAELKPASSRKSSKSKDEVVVASQKDTVPQFASGWLKFIESMNQRVQANSRRNRAVIIYQPNGVHTPSTSSFDQMSTDVGYGTDVCTSPIQDDIVDDLADDLADDMDYDEWIIVLYYYYFKKNTIEFPQELGQGTNVP